MTDDPGHADRLAVLSAIAAALGDPVRLLRLVTDAEDDEDAVRKVAAAYDVDDHVARALTDLQFGRLTRAGRARLSEELRILRAPWGPPVEAEVRFTTRRAAVLRLGGVERPFTAGGRDAVLDLLVRHLHEDVAVPSLRPVVAEVTGLTGGPVRMTVTPAGHGRYDYPGDGPG